MLCVGFYETTTGGNAKKGEKAVTVEVNLRRNRDGRQTRSAPLPASDARPANSPLARIVPTMSLLRWTTAASLIALAPCQAQSAMSPTDTSSPPPAAAADVRSMDAIMHAYYDVISGPAGNRDWNRFYSLFVPGGRLIRTSRAAPDSTPRTVVMTPQEFAQKLGPYFAKNSFYEKEISSHSVDTFGAITQRFSTYASMDATGDAKPSGRGIYSAQLFNDGKRWYIVTMYWDNEHPGTASPSRYLSSK
jgi:hypothetical protein